MTDIQYLLCFAGIVSLASAYTCTSFTAPIKLDKAPSLIPNFTPFQHDQDSVQFLNDLTSRLADSSPLGAATTVSTEIQIAAKYCIPTSNSNGIVQFLAHGIGFDQSYWDFGGPASEYNYIRSATAAGYATLSYDRIGTGNSTKTNPYTTQQLGPETAVLTELTTLLRNGKLSDHAGCEIPKPRKTIHVGHSFGSIISAEFSRLMPGLSDGLVLTGFSTNGSFMSNFGVSSNFHIAQLSDPKRFGEFDKGYLTWGDALSNQYSFFWYPYFDVEVLHQAERMKMPFAVGEALTVAVPALENFEFKGPVLIISGEYDRIFCGGACDGILEQGQAFFPNAQPFETYIQPNMGHGMNLHRNTTVFYEVVNSWIRTHVKVR